MKPNYGKIISLNWTNYHKWREKMKDVLFIKILHLHVFATQKPENKFDEGLAFEHMIYSYIC